MHTIEDAARKLGEDRLMMETYERAENGKQSWFFTKNRTLDGAVSKPTSFPSKESEFMNWWKGLHQGQKKVLYTYGDFVSWWTSFSEISKKEYEDIKSAYQEWPSSYYGVYYGVKIYSCNLFVGEALFMHGRKIMKNGKYFSAHEIWEGYQPYRLVKKEKVKPGHIAAMFGHHVEIVTSVDHKAGTFCSRGAGRGSGDGLEKCRQDGREINSKEIRFYHI